MFQAEVMLAAMPVGDVKLNALLSTTLVSFHAWTVPLTVAFQAFTIAVVMLALRAVELVEFTDFVELKAF